MSGKNPAKKLLACAIEAGGESNSGNISSESDREWLRDAVKNITSTQVDLIERLKECLENLQAFKVTGSLSIDYVVELLEELANMCEDIDVACDFQKIGGFEVVIELLDHSSSEIQVQTANLIAILSQNNPHCQNIFLNDFDVLSNLLKKTTNCNSDFDKNMAIKSMYAISCLIRQNKVGIEKFLYVDGFFYLLKGIQSNVPKLRLKSIFLLRSLCKEDHEVHAAVNTEEYVTALVKLLHDNDNFDVVEFGLDTLITLICHQVDFRNRCKLIPDQFKNAVNNLVSNSVIVRSYPEIIECSQQLLKILHL